MEKRLPRAYACYSDLASVTAEPSPEARMAAERLALVLRACDMLARAFHMAKTRANILPMLAVLLIQDIILPRIGE